MKELQRVCAETSDRRRNCVAETEIGLLQETEVENLKDATRVQKFEAGRKHRRRKDAVGDAGGQRNSAFSMTSLLSHACQTSGC